MPNSPQIIPTLVQNDQLIQGIAMQTNHDITENLSHRKRDISLSVVIPVYNDSEVLSALYERLMPVLNGLCQDYEVVMVDDGSSDDSFSIMSELRAKDDKLVLLKLTRNFGQANAITAGLENARYEYMAIMDSDLQDPPEFLVNLLNACIESGSDMAIARRVSRKDNWLKRLMSNLFNRISLWATTIKVQPGMGVFRVMTKKSFDKIRDVPEATGTTLSLMYWSGFRYVTVDLDRDERHAGESGYTIRKMFQLAMDRIFSYSLWPLRLATMLGFLVALISFFLGLLIIIRRLFLYVSIPGWASSNVLILFMFGLNFIIMGIIGEYIGRIYMEAKRRPKYVIEKKI